MIALAMTPFRILPCNPHVTVALLQIIGHAESSLLTPTDVTNVLHGQFSELYEKSTHRRPMTSPMLVVPLWQTTPCILFLGE